MGKISLISAASIGIISILIWVSVIAPELTSSPEILEITARNIGMIQFTDNIGDELSDPTKMVFDWKREVIEEYGSNVLIHTTYHYRDILTDDTFWKLEFDEAVTKSSREYLDKPGHFMFPSNLEKKDYQVFDVGGSVLQYSFEGIDEIDGLKVYKFSGQTTFDISEIYSDFSEQIFEDYSAINYIDPVTGIEVSFSEEFTDYAIINGEKIPVLHAWSDTTSFSQATLVNNIKHLQTLYFVYNSLVPFIFAIVTIGVVIGIILQNRITKNQQQLLSTQKELQEERVKTLQEQLKNERFAAIGTLASRMAHDMKNPLSIINGVIQYFKLTQTLDEKASDHIDRLERASNRLDHQITNVLDFVKMRDAVMKESSIKPIVNSALDGIKFPPSITIKKEITDCTLKCDPHLLEVVFINIVTNAMQAMKNSGKITIQVIDKTEEIEIKIENDGPKIFESDLIQIFEPLFSTKMEGTGLGLASCKTIVQQHGGTIQAYNDPTRFVIKLPKWSS